MTLEEENQKYLAELEEKAKALVGTWVADLIDGSYYFVYDYYVSDSMCDVVLNCFYIPYLDCPCTPKEDEIYMSDFKEYYKKGSKKEGEKRWKNLRGLLDNLLLGKTEE